MIDVDYPKLLDLFREYLDPKRSESASFLIWYLENYYRLDQLEAVDSVCDQSGDKGVDGIFVNDNDQTITVFQGKILQNKNATIGDASLREFAGTLTQFKDTASIQNLINTAGTAQVAALAKRLDLTNKIASYELRAEFLSNVDLDANGASFLKTVPHISFVGKTRLITTYISDERDLPVHGPVEFDIVGLPVSEYVVDADTKTIIAPIKAKELVKMDGIVDQSIFAYNVRGPLGKTGVNRDIVNTIRDARSHKLFPLFHNGITVIAGQLEANEQKLSASDYFVVNGCQSLTALFDNEKALTDNLRVLVKFIKMDPRSAWAAKITQYSNNQNGVKARDFKANNPIQIRLQNEFEKNYSGEYTFEIKRGELLGSGTIISNEEAGLYLMAFDLQEPWATHRKYQVFEDKYADIFGGPQVTADRLVLCRIIMDAIKEGVPIIKNKLFAQYALTRYMLLYIIRNILDNEAIADEIMKTPEAFVRNENDRDHFRKCIDSILSDVLIDVNGEVEGFGDNFDYRDKLRDEEWVKSFSARITADYLKFVARKRIKSFTEEWNELQSQPTVVTSRA